MRRPHKRSRRWVRAPPSMMLVDPAKQNLGLLVLVFMKIVGADDAGRPVCKHGLGDVVRDAQCRQPGFRLLPSCYRAFADPVVGYGKFDPKRRAAVDPISCRYRPVVRLDNGARDGQSHAHAFRLAGEKRFEDLL